MVLNKLMEMQDVATETSLNSQLIHSIMTQLRQWRSDYDDIFLFDADTVPATDAAWPVVTFNVELATFMSALVAKSSSSLSTDEWDFILCSLVAWFQTLQSAASLSHPPHSLFVMALMTAVSRLLQRTAVCIHNVVPQQLDTYPTSLISEWQDVFSCSVFEMALPLFVSLSSAASHATRLMVRVCAILVEKCTLSALISFLHCSHMSFVSYSSLVC